MSVFTALLAALAAVALAACRRPLRGTTLVAPLAWAVVALAALAGAEAAAALAPSAARLPHVRLVAAGGTFCPLMALLGAKRPQDQGWQFVVLSLWGLVAFYGLTELAYRPHRSPELHGVVRWLLVAPLVGMGLVNHLFTRYAMPAILVALGQVALLSPQLPEIQRWLPAGWALGRAGDAAALVGIVLLSLAAAAAVALARHGDAICRSANLPPGAPSLGSPVPVPPGSVRVWRDFRDAFGTFWGLRVAARFNQSAEQLGWDIRLAWHGFETPRGSSEVPPTDASDGGAALPPAAGQALTSLLLRFVDADWLACRWAAEASEAAPASAP